MRSHKASVLILMRNVCSVPVLLLRWDFLRTLTHLSSTDKPLSKQCSSHKAVRFIPGLCTDLYVWACPDKQPNYFAFIVFLIKWNFAFRSQGLSLTLLSKSTHHKGQRQNKLQFLHHHYNQPRPWAKILTWYYFQADLCLWWTSASAVSTSIGITGLQ